MGTHPIFESDFDCLTEWPQFSPGTESSDTALLPLVSTTASMLTTSSLSSELTSERKKSKSPRLTWSRLTSPTSLSRKRARRTPTFSAPGSLWQPHHQRQEGPLPRTPAVHRFSPNSSHGPSSIFPRQPDAHSQLPHRSQQEARHRHLQGREHRFPQHCPRREQRRQGRWWQCCSRLRLDLYFVNCSLEKRSGLIDHL